ncbi:MAG: 3-phosphoserine/phosphohydroxythreonine transaminase [Actinobacteria bacterium]|nr:3-phosphoserine/phosphohydroxythreonine transaminase [Actinomycetota bacterium]
MNRAHNFCSGPCTLPVSVLERLAADIVDYQGSGMSLLEMSHRSDIYDRVHHHTIDLLRRVCAVPDEFNILLLQGGASLQFAMIPMNLLGPGRSAGYVLSGTWGKGAYADASRIGEAYVAWDGNDSGFTTMPAASDLEVRPGVDYIHTTSNETIGGVRMPDLFGLDVPQVIDMSSDFLTRPIPWDNYDVVYGGAQKNLGPAGLTIVFVRKTALDQAPPDLPKYLDLAVHAKTDSLANTPPMFSIWATGLMLEWIIEQGGIEAMNAAADLRSGMVYDTIDASDGFYRSPVAVDVRSKCNMVWRIADGPGDIDLEAKFLAEAEDLSLLNLKGHRSVGGIRSSIYNGLPTSSVQALVDFMTEFASTNSKQ